MVFGQFIFVYYVPVRFNPVPLLALLLCQCAAKHQPQEFTPYFALKPRGTLSPELFWERRALETQAGLSPLEKKKLLELYELELKHLKPQSPLHEKLKEEAAFLQAEIGSLQEESREAWADALEAQRKLRTPGEARTRIGHKGLRRAYDEAYRLWNSDQNPEALEKVHEILRNEDFRDDAADDDWIPVQYLRFRVAIDVAQLGVAEESYVALKKLDDCGERTATAGFLVALHQFVAGNSRRAQEILVTQCDPDKSVSQQLKTAYWKGRFAEPSMAEPQAAYADVLRTRIPGYYFYLATTRLGLRVEFSTKSFGSRTYLRQELTFPRSVKDLVARAEGRLKAGLRRDAEAYLLHASARLRVDPDEEDLPGLLYLAHLLQAAGSHVEAVRLYSIVTEKMQETGVGVVPAFDFVEEMFPRPFAVQVDGAARQWGLDPDLIYALMRQESAFNPEAVSVVDARGLMQLMPFLAKHLADEWGYSGYYGDRFLFHGDENLKLASYHLHQLRGLAPHIALIAASYNAGLSRTSGWWKRFGHLPLDVFVELIPITETRNYVKLVIRNYLYYKALRAKGSIQAGLVPMELPAFTGFSSGLRPRGIRRVGEDSRSNRS